jgi:hypothetical protein
MIQSTALSCFYIAIGCEMYRRGILSLFGLNLNIKISVRLQRQAEQTDQSRNEIRIINLSESMFDS